MDSASVVTAVLASDKFPSVKYCWSLGTEIGWFHIFLRCSCQYLSVCTVVINFGDHWYCEEYRAEDRRKLLVLRVSHHESGIMLGYHAGRIRVGPALVYRGCMTH